jgi:NAD(P)-dependent dehydrogenase (short-subunit alcohol dehydrogenase family)
MSKNIIITGTSSGIGFELVKIFAQKKNRVLALSRDNSKLRNLKLDGVDAIDFDINNPDESMLDQFINSVNRIDVLINNAGYLVKKTFEETTLADFQNIYSTNVFSVAMLVQRTISYMHEGSNVINISSIGGVQGTIKFPGLSAYGSSKGALNILTEILAEEYKDKKVHFNSLALGSVQTKMLEEAFPGYKASTSAENMAKYIYNFATEGYKLMNGKVVSISSSTP